MIRYALVCENEDEFEGWFASSDAFDQQSGSGQIACPVCGAVSVRKAPMAPSIVSPKRKTAAKERAKAVAALRKHLAEDVDYVGDKFAEEARAIHAGDAEDRPIWGQSTLADAKTLIEEGVPVAPLPPELAPQPPREKLN
jgi:hypothetical protein